MPKISDLVSENLLKKIGKRPFPIERSGNVLIFNSLDSNKSPSSFVFLMNGLLQVKIYNIKISFDQLSERLFPNGCVPIAAAAEYYKNLGVKFEIVGDGHDSYLPNIFSPMLATREAIKNESNILSRIWKFSNAQMIYQLVEAYVYTLVEKIEAQKGFVEAFEWCLNEIMDNVLLHSGGDAGYVMLQIHPQSGKVAICVSDSGIGIYGSLKNSKYKPKNSVDAITLAVQESVTRDNTVGQGNGLWGLLQIVVQNGGNLFITSGASAVAFITGEPRVYPAIPAINLGENQGATIDFQFDTTKPIDVITALKAKYRGESLSLEKKFSNDDLKYDEAIILIREHGHGYGTRSSGKMLRNTIQNLMTIGKNKIIIDFNQVALISSSFADELIAKLMKEIGFYNFQKFFEIKNLNEINQQILQRSVALRLAEELQDNRDTI